MSDDGIEMAVWTVYDHPLDYPTGFVARRFSLQTGLATDDVLYAPTLEAIRAKLVYAMGYAPHWVGRGEHDDPVIVESWI
jgi:hypothetical protein